MPALARLIEETVPAPAMGNFLRQPEAFRKREKKALRDMGNFEDQFIETRFLFPHLPLRRPRFSTIIET